MLILQVDLTELDADFSIFKDKNGRHFRSK